MKERVLRFESNPDDRLDQQLDKISLNLREYPLLLKAWVDLRHDFALLQLTNSESSNIQLELGEQISPTKLHLLKLAAAESLIEEIESFRSKLEREKDRISKQTGTVIGPGLLIANTADISIGVKTLYQLQNSVLPSFAGICSSWLHRETDYGAIPIPTDTPLPASLSKSLDKTFYQTGNSTLGYVVGAFEKLIKNRSDRKITPEEFEFILAVVTTTLEGLSSSDSGPLKPVTPWSKYRISPLTQAQELVVEWKNAAYCYRHHSFKLKNSARMAAITEETTGIEHFFINFYEHLTAAAFNSNHEVHFEARNFIEMMDRIYPGNHSFLLVLATSSLEREVVDDTCNLALLARSSYLAYQDTHDPWYEHAYQYLLEAGDIEIYKRVFYADEAASLFFPHAGVTSSSQLTENINVIRKKLGAKFTAIAQTTEYKDDDSDASSDAFGIRAKNYTFSNEVDAINQVITSKVIETRVLEDGNSTCIVFSFFIDYAGSTPRVLIDVVDSENVTLEFEHNVIYAVVQALQALALEFSLVSTKTLKSQSSTAKKKKTDTPYVESLLKEQRVAEVQTVRTAPKLIITERQKKLIKQKFDPTVAAQILNKINEYNEALSSSPNAINSPLGRAKGFTEVRTKKEVWQVKAGMYRIRATYDTHDRSRAYVYAIYSHSWKDEFNLEE